MSDNPYASPREQGAARNQYQRRAQMLFGFVALIGFGYVTGIMTTMFYSMPPPAALPSGTFEIQVVNFMFMSGLVLIAIRGLYKLASELDRRELP